MRAGLPDAGPALGDYVGEAWQSDAINPQEILKRSEGLKSPQPDDFLSRTSPIWMIASSSPALAVLMSSYLNCLYIGVVLGFPNRTSGVRKAPLPKNRHGGNRP